MSTKCGEKDCSAEAEIWTVLETIDRSAVYLLEYANLIRGVSGLGKESRTRAMWNWVITIVRGRMLYVVKHVDNNAGGEW